MRIAAVHEWLSSSAGSEKVFEEIAAVLPDADLFALTWSPTYSGFGYPSLTNGRPVSTTVLQRAAWIRDHREISLPMMPLAWRLLTRQPYDALVTSSHAFARRFPVQTGCLHVCYVHAPLRFAWTPEIDGRGASKLLSGPRSLLRRLDRSTVNNVHSFACNSNTVRQRVQRYYERDATVIYPPVDIARFRGGLDIAKPSDPFILGFSRWVPYKRLDLVIHAARLLGVRAVIAGAGPDEARLRSFADESGSPVTFEVRPSDKRVVELMGAAAVLAFPAEEDFGIVPVEAMAAGTPVACLGHGGASESVIDGVTGAHCAEQSAAAFSGAIERALNLQTSRSQIAAHAIAFSPERFRDGLVSWLTASGFDGLSASTA